VALFVVLSYPLLLLTCEWLEMEVGSYATFSDAAAALEPGGWLPIFLPEAAIEIREVHAIDSASQWLRFRAPALVVQEMTSVMRPISLEEARSTGVRRPWRGASGWPPELARFPLGAARGSEHIGLYRTADGVFCLLVEYQTWQVFAWRCGRVG
jgi:hypothetical protein